MAHASKPKADATSKTWSARERPVHRGLAPGVNAGMDRSLFAEALSLGTRKLDEMRSVGEIPKPDFFIDKSPQWTIETFNRYLDDRINTAS